MDNDHYLQKFFICFSRMLCVVSLIQMRYNILPNKVKTHTPNHPFTPPCQVGELRKEDRGGLFSFASGKSEIFLPQSGQKKREICRIDQE